MPKIGEDEPILTSIFFKWVGSTTNQLWVSLHGTNGPIESEGHQSGHWAFAACRAAKDGGWFEVWETKGWWEFGWATCQRNLWQLCSMLTHLFLMLLRLQSNAHWQCACQVIWAIVEQTKLANTNATLEANPVYIIGARCQVLLDAPDIYNKCFPTLSKMDLAQQQFHPWLPCPDEFLS